MANPNNPFGFRPLMVTIEGSPVKVVQYAKPSSDANAIFQFDFVRKVIGGVAADASAPLAVPVPTVQTYYTGTPGTTLFIGSSLNFGAASTQTYHYVVDAIDAVFAGQCSGATSITTASHVGKNANVSLAVAGSPTTHISGMQVDSSTIATTAGLDLRILRLLNVSPNAEGANAIVEVVIMKHQYAQGAAGV